MNSDVIVKSFLDSDHNSAIKELFHSEHKTLLKIIES